MDPLLKKLQFSGGRIVALKPPEEFEPMLQAWADSGLTLGRRPSSSTAMVIAFVRSCADIEVQAPKVLTAMSADALIWFAYPKKSSKRYTSDIGRDDSWQPLGDLGYEGVRQVALDDDWSALRFRPADDIATMTRAQSRRISAAGRARPGPRSDEVTEGTS